MSVFWIFKRIKYTGRKRIDQLGKRDIDTGNWVWKERMNEWEIEKEFEKEKKEVYIKTNKRK